MKTTTGSQPARLRPTISTIEFICPSCRGPLEMTATALRCPRCDSSYPVVDGRIDFVGGETSPPPVGPDSEGGFRRWLATLPSHPARWSEPVRSGITNDNGTLRSYLAGIGCHPPVLDLGSGRRRLDPNVVTTDIDAWPEVDVVADAHRLPFADATFGAIVFQSVIEHVRDPLQVLAEARRVLRNDGSIYVEAPFLYPEHDSADFRRWTRRGLELDMSRHFAIVESGIVMSGASALSLTWRAFLEDRTPRLHWGVRNLIAWATSWLPNLDRRPRPAGRAYAAAFVIGRPE